ncbi:MAG: hypothetical protein ACXVXJ_05625 [Mycobacteriaceae bacterium]
MKLRVETTQVQFIVSRLATPKVERDSGKQRADRTTGELLFQFQVMALDDTGGEVLNVSVCGEPKLTVGQQVRFDGLIAIPWSQGERSGVAFRCERVVPAEGARPVSAAKPAA